MLHAYDYIQGSHGEEIDCYMRPVVRVRRAVIVHQVKPNGMCDEHKVMLGFPNERATWDTYEAHQAPDQCRTAVAVQEALQWPEASLGKT